MIWKMLRWWNEYKANKDKVLRLQYEGLAKQLKIAEKYRRVLSKEYNKRIW